MINYNSPESYDEDLGTSFLYQRAWEEKGKIKTVVCKGELGFRVERGDMDLFKMA